MAYVEHLEYPATNFQTQTSGLWNAYMDSVIRKPALPLGTLRIPLTDVRAVFARFDGTRTD